jgi:hypothetical protein
LEELVSIAVDIADRLFDYTDEERAAAAVAEFQAETGIGDEAVVILWQDLKDPRRAGLEKKIFDAVDANGSAKRARETVPGGVTLILDTGN